MVYQKLCRLHIEVSKLTHRWPPEEKHELGSQARRSSNSAPAQLAEKYDDRHVRNNIEGINRSRGDPPWGRRARIMALLLLDFLAPEP